MQGILRILSFLFLLLGFALPGCGREDEPVLVVYAAVDASSEPDGGEGVVQWQQTRVRLGKEIGRYRVENAELVGSGSQGRERDSRRRESRERSRERQGARLSPMGMLITFQIVEEDHDRLLEDLKSSEVRNAAFYVNGRVLLVSYGLAPASRRWTVPVQGALEASWFVRSLGGQEPE